MFWHGIEEIQIDRQTGKILQIMCKCGKVFCPTEASSFETFNAHLEKMFEGLASTSSDRTEK